MGAAGNVGRVAMRLTRPGGTLATGALLVLAGGWFFARCKEPVPVGELTPAPVGESWINLLDEEHAAQWRNISGEENIFEIDQGVLHIFGQHPLRYVGYTGRTFADFELHIEYKLTKRANSGVFLRAQPDDPVYRGFEVQVLDDFGDAPDKNGSGAIYDVVTPMFNMSRPAGEWNAFDITVQGQEVIVFMNDWRVIHTDFSKMTAPLGKFEIPFADLPLEGHLVLQDHGGEVWYRNIMVRPLEANEER
jgi:hypothetical protein